MMRILIVDDNCEMRRLIRGLTRDVAAECFECGDGREAVAAYERHRPDWVLMDIEMGEMDGIRATKEIMTSFPEARVVIVTHYGDADFRDASQAAGACGYVLKENLLDVAAEHDVRAVAKKNKGSR